MTAVEEESTKAVGCFWLTTFINHPTSVDPVKREKASFSIPLATHCGVSGSVSVRHLHTVAPIINGVFSIFSFKEF
jgi:hypothetical protein